MCHSCLHHVSHGHRILTIHCQSLESFLLLWVGSKCFGGVHWLVEQFVVVICHFEVNFGIPINDMAVNVNGLDDSESNMGVF